MIYVFSVQGQGQLREFIRVFIIVGIFDLTRIVKDQDKLTQEDVKLYNEIIENLPQKEQELINDYSEKSQARPFVAD